MKSYAIVVSVFCCSILLLGSVQLYGQLVSASSIPYGDNKDAGHYAVLNGVRLYYEKYTVRGNHSFSCMAMAETLRG